MSNPWDVAPLAPKGDDDPARLYHAVGMTLTQWEILEDTMAALFATILRSDSPSVGAAYGSVVASAARIDMILAAATAEGRWINGPVFEELRVFLNEVGKLAGRRNEIAHGTVTTYSGGTHEGSYLAPPRYNTRKRIPARSVSGAVLAYPFAHQKYAYTAEQIHNYGLHFWVYVEKAWAWIDRLRAEWEAFAKTDAARRGAPPPPPPPPFPEGH